MLDIAARQRIVNLVADNAGPVRAGGNSLCTLQVARAEVADPDVPHLALPHKVVERTKRFFQRNKFIAVVQLKQVYMIAANAPKTRFHRPHDVRAAEPDVVVTGSCA